METLQQITQEIIAQVEGAAFTDETKFEEDFVDALVHQVRADLYVKNRKNMISPLWTQTFYPTYNSFEQDTDNCYVQFYCPAPILLKNCDDGIAYVGANNQLKAFPRIGLYGTVATDMAHPITNPDKKGVWSYDLEYNIYTGKLVVKIYGNKDIQTFRMDYIHFNPTENPNYRRSTDLYPISGELLIDLKAGVFNKLMAQMAGVPQDNLSDSNDLTNKVQPSIKTK